MKSIKGKLINAIIKNNFLRKKLLGFSIYLNNVSYSLIKSSVAAPGELHPKHSLMNYHKFFLDNIESGDVVLDIGCGNGSLAFDMASKAKRVVGIDIAEKNIKIANAKFSRDNLNLVCGNAVEFDYSSFGIEKFDKIVLSNILEHIDERVEFLDKLHKLSDTVLLRVPMITRDWLALYKKENGYPYVLSSEHFIEYTDENLQAELDKSDWQIEKKSVQFGETWAVLKSKR